MKTFTTLLLAMALLIATPAWSARVTYSFDTVTDIEYVTDSMTSLPMYLTTIIVTGVEKDTGNPLSISILERRSASGAGFDNEMMFQRCVPVILMAIDKPGKYFLHLEREEVESFNQNFYGCKIEQKI